MTVFTSKRFWVFLAALAGIGGMYFGDHCSLIQAAQAALVAAMTFIGGDSLRKVGG